MSKEALEGSIKKWKGIIKGTAKDNGTSNCALCQEYYFLAKSCLGCPVKKKTKEVFCINTPYQEWDDHFDMVHHDSGMPHKRVPYCRECLRIAKEELAFLESLRTIYKEDK